MEDTFRQQKDSFAQLLPQLKDGIELILSIKQNELSEEEIKAFKHIITLLYKTYPRLRLDDLNFILSATMFYLIISIAPKEECSEEEIHNKEILGEFFKTNYITNKLIVDIRKNVSFDLDLLSELGITPPFTTGIPLDILNYVQGIEDGINKNKYPFIKSIDKEKLAYIFIILYKIPYKRLQIHIRHSYKNVEWLYNLSKKKKLESNAPSYLNAIKQTKGDYFLNGRFKLLRTNDEEIIEFLLDIFSKFMNGDTKGIIAYLIYPCFKFEWVNEKGTASLLYGLFRLLPYVRLPSYEEWLLSKEDSNEMDDKNTWALFQKRSIEKIMVLR